MSEQIPSTIDSREFRNACGHFATGITIVTTELDGEFHGMTANAFVSVSLDPPLVLVSVDHRASMHERLPKTGRYAVSILRHDQEHLSTHFAGRPDPDLPDPFVQRNGMPVIDGAIAYLTTKIVDMHLAGDHTLYIGEVDYIEYNDDDPILYYVGKYRKLS